MGGVIEIERPTLVVGIGGMGKHVVTHIKHALVTRYGELPEEVSIFALDTAEHLDVRKAAIDAVTDWDRVEFTLDYSPTSTEFVHFGGNWGEPVSEIAAGKGRERGRPHPYISHWLKRDDAELYMGLTDEDLSAKRGVGRMRQASRVCLFLRLGEEVFVRKLRELVRRVARFGTELRPMRVIIVGSIAGGTGCGALWDVAMLIRYFAQEYEAAQFIGVFVLPKGFEGLRATELSEVQQREMEANCYAAFRELERLMQVAGPERPCVVGYSEILKRVELRGRLFDFVYLADGTPLSVLAERTPPYLHYHEGIAPAIADFVHLHLLGITDDYIGLSSGMARCLQDARDYPRDAGIYSSFGIHRVVFDARGLVETFAPQLAREVVDRFVDEDLPRAGRAQIEEEVVEFLSGPDNTRFNQTVAELLQRPDTLAMSESLLLQVLRPEGVRPVQVRPLELAVVQVSKLGRARPSGEVVAEAERLVAAHLGTDRDQLGERAAAGSLHAVLNYYFEQSRLLFRAILQKAVEQRADGVRNPASLLYTEDFLNELLRGYESFGEQLVTAAQRVEHQRKNVASAADRARTQLGRSQSGRDQARFLQMRQEEVRWQKLSVLLRYLGRLTEDHRELVEKLRDEVAGYIAGLRSVQAHMVAVGASVKHVRRSLKTFRVRSYVTEPDDRWERRLYELSRGEEPRGGAEEALAALLPRVQVSNLVKEFSWRVVEEGGAWTFKGYLADTFVPAEASQRDVDRWNYHFIRRMVEMGHLRRLEENLNIFDILAWQAAEGKDARSRQAACEAEAQRLAEQLRRRSRFLIQYDQAAQARESRYGARVPALEERYKVLAPWKNTEPGRWVSEPLRRLVDGFDEDLRESAHEIVARSTAHHLRMAAVASLAQTEEVYLEHIRRRRFPPVHVFLAERNAALYEKIVADKRYPGVARPVFCPQVVALLEHETDLRVFARAYALKKLRREWVGDEWVFRFTVRHGAGEYPVDLPGSLREAAEMFCAPGGVDPALKETFASQVAEEWEALRATGGTAFPEGKELQGAEEPGVLRELAGEGARLREEASRAASPAEGDFFVVLSVMLDTDVDIMRDSIRRA